MDFLYVYPNPFSAFDKDGHPCGVCPRDPDADAGGPGQYVGARVDSDKTEVLQDFGKMAPHELRSPMQRTKYSYLGISSDAPDLIAQLVSKEPIRLPMTRYYRERLVEGSIISADAATAMAARVSHFAPPAEYFKQHAPVVVEAPAPEMPAAAPVASSSVEPSADSTATKKRAARADSEAT